MIIQKHNLGPERWHLTVIIDSWVQNSEFKAWMDENCPECMCVRRFNSGGRPFWEVRGGAQEVMMLIVMTWG